MLHLTSHPASTPQFLIKRLVGIYSSATNPSTDSLKHLTLNPRDPHRRKEPTLEQQHHGDHRGLLHTRAWRPPAIPPILRIAGSDTSPASPPPLEPRPELLSARMKEKEEVGARLGVRKKRVHRDRFIARDRCSMDKVHPRPSLADIRERIREQCRPHHDPRGECALRRQPARRALPQYGLGALRLDAVREKVRGKHAEERARQRSQR